MVYNEEDLMGLKLNGKNVYDSEKKAYLRIIDDLLQDQSMTKNWELGAMNNSDFRKFKKKQRMEYYSLNH